MIRRVTNPLHIVYIYIYTHSYILARHVHACTPTRVFITSFDNPSSAEQRSPPTGRKLGYQASEYLRVPAKFSAHIDPVPSFFRPSPHSVTHARVLHVFLPLFSSWHGTTVCDPLVICATSASYFDVGARGFADARHRKSSPLTMQDRGSKSQRHSEMRRREVG